MEDYKFCRYCIKHENDCVIADKDMSCYQPDVELIALEHENEINRYKHLLSNANDMIHEIIDAVDPIRWNLEELKENMDIDTLIDAINKIDEIIEKY